MSSSSPAPGGPANRGLVDRSVIAALGHGATLVNIARGEIADEPNVPLALRRLDNIVLAPHLGSATIETRHAVGESIVRSLERLLNPV